MQHKNLSGARAIVWDLVATKPNHSGGRDLRSARKENSQVKHRQRGATIPKQTHTHTHNRKGESTGSAEPQWTLGTQGCEDAWWTTSTAARGTCSEREGRTCKARPLCHTEGNFLHRKMVSAKGRIQKDPSPKNGPFRVSPGNHRGRMWARGHTSAPHLLFLAATHCPLPSGAARGRP